MIDLDLDMRQYDCPFIDTTDEVDVRFSAMQWQLDTNREQLETRLLVEGDERGELAQGLRTLREHPNMTDCATLKKSGGVATVRTRIEQTDAMGVVEDHGGYITGPFRIEGGTETWHVGFDEGTTADRALSELDDENDVVVESRTDLSVAELFDVIENAGAAHGLLNSCRALTETERETLVTAAEAGYFETPRELSLDDLADEFGVSKTAASMNLRRAERKLVDSTVDSLSSIDGLE
ncbi:HTH-10 family transcription regulator [Natronomonas moolapensis 8.8.11]|uniref:HTH-10 family transcription regulator n=1 Tax=Natronomonas moolapensis (strain DSM 18674 / CECT 7526 / JCM 14361 / 8.8.11) TaxID=268739 RepID=M1XZ35_NATM8|nr:helix-turn-helix domain-containing protein [Natronomonas moolapensis]CCQ35409.1 HTH-10 family transcription regulator [Natronomonas moolapensis 8.8.11]